MDLEAHHRDNVMSCFLDRISEIRPGGEIRPGEVAERTVEDTEGLQEMMACCFEDIYKGQRQ